MDACQKDGQKEKNRINKVWCTAIGTNVNKKIIKCIHKK